MRARKRAEGGWDAELDVLAYDPSNYTLLHVETSGDADSWAERKLRFRTKKFILTKEEYEAILGCKVSKIRKIAVVGYARSTKADLTQIYHRLPEIEAKNLDFRDIWGLHLFKPKLFSDL